MVRFHQGHPIFMKYLKKDEFSLVKPRFQRMVLNAWNSNNEVPYGIILCSDEPATSADLNRARELNAIYNWE